LQKRTPPQKHKQSICSGTKINGKNKSPLKKAGGGRKEKMGRSTVKTASSTWRVKSAHRQKNIRHFGQEELRRHPKKNILIDAIGTGGNF